MVTHYRQAAGNEQSHPNQHGGPCGNELERERQAGNKKAVDVWHQERRGPGGRTRSCFREQNLAGKFHREDAQVTPQLPVIFVFRFVETVTL